MGVPRGQGLPLLMGQLRAHNLRCINRLTCTTALPRHEHATTFLRSLFSRGGSGGRCGKRSFSCSLKSHLPGSMTRQTNACGQQADAGCIKIGQGFVPGTTQSPSRQLVAKAVLLSPRASPTARTCVNLQSFNNCHQDLPAVSLNYTDLLCGRTTTDIFHSTVLPVLLVRQAAHEHGSLSPVLNTWHSEHEDAMPCSKTPQSDKKETQPGTWSCKTRWTYLCKVMQTTLPRRLKFSASHTCLATAIATDMTAVSHSQTTSETSTSALVGSSTHVHQNLPKAPVRIKAFFRQRGRLPAPNVNHVET